MTVGDRGPLTPGIFGYGAVCGVSSFAAGAAVSLTAVGLARLVVWITVTTALSVAAGLSYDAPLTRAVSRVLWRWLTGSAAS